MKRFFQKRTLLYNLLFLVLFGLVLYATGYHVRVYSGLKNTLIRSGIITPKSLASISFQQAEVAPENLLGMELVSENGERVTLGDFEKEVVLINFWASWCPPCVAEMPGLNTLYETKKEEVGFVLITWDKTMEAAQNFRDRKGYSFPVYQTVGKVPDPLHVSSIPTTFILDKKEKTLYRYAGMIDFEDPEMASFLNTLGR